MTDMPTADKTIDCREMQCPMPILKAKKEILKIKVGETLEVLSNDPGSKEDFPRWAKRTGNEFIGIFEDEDTHYFIKRLV